MDLKQYPPRCKARVVAKHKRFFAKASRKIKIQCKCNTKQSYKGKISIPCSSNGMYKHNVIYDIVTLSMADVYGENSSESDSDSSTQQAGRLRSSVTSG